jgi:hypothetical protein
MVWLSRWFVATVTGLGGLAAILAVWYLVPDGWLGHNENNKLLDSLQKIVTVLVVFFGAILAYVRFFAYGLVFHLADTEVRVEVLPHSAELNLHFINLRVANKGTFRLKIETLSWTATDHNKAGEDRDDSGTALAGVAAESLRHQAIDRGETINLLFAGRMVDSRVVASSSYLVTLKASGRIWYAPCAVSNSPAKSR